jgi:opacity protein-like surface antigen
MRFSILIFAACAVLPSPVFAADVTPTMPLGPPVFASNPWEGFYFGGHVAYAFGTSSYLNNPPGVPASGSVGLYGEDVNGELGPLTGGLQSGYNHVSP